MNPQLVAFLEMLRVSEGTATHPLTKNRGYDVIVTGIDSQGHPAPEVFTDYSTHPFCTGRPPKLINRQGLRSDAAGGYQLMARYWPPYKLLLRLPDFGPDSQDCVAVQQIKECHALDDVLTGHFTIAVGKVARIWASLPGANYPGQHMNQLAALEDVFERSGGKFA